MQNDSGYIIWGVLGLEIIFIEGLPTLINPSYQRGVGFKDLTALLIVLNKNIHRKENSVDCRAISFGIFSSSEKGFKKRLD